ncbi:unnamed protein product [Spirodela intermedia]|uniref:Uncharacterized protein n=1 Tax=Spirodela intermedia TaxID=51605 RepID=A0A7I8J142_SPIIN|nr:unnamed protein product [Spirodela intermedia]CAA6663946.1 unnamed protein product [Spirodela intermedia]
MSGRLLRKVLREQELKPKDVDPEIDAEDSPESPVSAAPFRNPFDLLDDQKKKKKSKEKGDQKLTAEQSIVSIIEELSIDAKPVDKQDVRNSRTANEIRVEEKKQSTSYILTVDPKYLKAENELRKIFGSKVVSSFENHQNVTSSREDGSCFSPGFWPRWDGSLSMEILESKNGIQYFRYVHTPSYMHAQEVLEMARSTHDLNAIASILARYPYHVEALLIFAEVFKFSGEHQSAADAIGKCLFALECAWHPLFNPLQGNCQVKYSHETNRPLFQALFQHMSTSLSLDSDDPMGALFCIDYFALRAQEFEWLEQFSERYKSDSSIWLFPNFSFALAICRFYLESASSREPTGESEKAPAMPLKDQAWTQILNSSFFKSAQAGTPSLEHLISIYVERSYIMWRLPELQGLLKEAALQVVESLKRDGGEAKDWACVRKEAFPSEKNEYSHLLISDFSDTAPTLPPEEIRHFMLDPQMVPEVPGENRDGDPGGARAPRDVAGRNPLLVFLESLLPWADYGTDQQQEHQQQQQQGEDQ